MEKENLCKNLGKRGSDNGASDETWEASEEYFRRRSREEKWKGRIRIKYFPPENMECGILKENFAELFGEEPSSDKLAYIQQIDE